MTARDAFAIAFDDEVVAMDADPVGKAPQNAGKASGISGGAKTNMEMSAAAKGAPKSAGQNKSLAEHKAEGCEAVQNGHPNLCPYIQSIKRDFVAQGMSNEQAMEKALQMHNAAGIKDPKDQKNQEQDTKGQATAPGSPQSQAPQPVNPEAQEAEAQQIAQQGAQAVLNKLGSEKQADKFPEPKPVETSSGTLNAQTVGQEATILVSQASADKGSRAGEQALDAIKEAQTDGTITSGGEPQVGNAPTAETGTGQKTERVSREQFSPSVRKVRIQRPKDEPVRPQPRDGERTAQGGNPQAETGNSPQEDATRTQDYNALKQKFNYLGYVAASLKNQNGTASLGSKDAEYLSSIPELASYLTMEKNDIGLYNVKAKEGYEEVLNKELEKLASQLGIPADNGQAQSGNTRQTLAQAANFITSPYEQGQQIGSLGGNQYKGDINFSRLSPEDARRLGKELDEESTRQAREDFLENAKPGTVVTLGWGRKAVKNEDGSWTLTVPKRVDGYNAPKGEYDDGGSTTNVERVKSIKTSRDIAAYEQFKVDGKHIESLVPNVYKDIARVPLRDDNNGGGPPKKCPICSTPLNKDGKCPNEDKHKKNKNGGDDPVPPTPLTPPDNPTDSPANSVAGGGDDGDGRSTLSSAPSDEEFRVGKNKYKVGDITYTDVSGMGKFRAALTKFMAGLTGGGVITDWDRISGTWDAMKRSAKGESVRDGILGAIVGNEIMSAGQNQNLSDTAKADLARIQETYMQAQTQEQKMEALEWFKMWKDAYSKELGQKDTGGYTSLANKNPEWQAPPAKIFPEVSKDERDTSYMENMKQRIGKRIGGIAEIVDSINGSSVVQFKVRRLEDGTDKTLRDALQAMQTDIGTKISYTPDTTSGAERMGTITINNPKVKDASMQRLLEDKEAYEAARKMEIPLMLGETAEGRTMYVDLKDHGFLGGDSGSGKSERVIGAVSGAFAVKSPSELQVVFNAHANDADYDGFSDDPHTGGIGRNVEEVALNLANANAEWKRRQKLFAKVGARNIKDYNKAMEAAGTPEKKLPSILIITDEVTDLLAQRPDLAEEIDAIVRNGRKFGVAHLGVTQDMGADNMPSRIKGATRMGVQSGSATASKKIFDVHAPELANLNRKGDIMVRDSSGQLVRLRGTYADENTRNALRDYNTGKIKPLPKEYADGIEQAIQQGSKVSIEAIEGMENAFKAAIPEGWTISEEEVDGTKYWKATPPSKKPEATPQEKESASGEAGSSANSEAPTSEETNSDWTSATTRKEAVNILNKVHKDAKAKAFAEYKASKKTEADKKKYLKALEKADKDLAAEMTLVDGTFPTIVNGDTIEEEGESPESSTLQMNPAGGEKEQEPEWESPLTRAEKPENRIADARKEYEEAAKELKRRIGTKKDGITPQQYKEELKKLDDDYKDYVAQVKAGKSDSEIYAAREEAKKQKEETEKAELERKRSLVRTTALKNPKRKIVGATPIMESYMGDKKDIIPMPRQMLSKVKLPEGFELDTDHRGKPVVIPENGRLHGFARHPNGSWGKIDSNGVFHLMVDTDSPHILGEDHEETEKARQKWLNAETKEEEEEAQKDYYRKAYGVESREVKDEAPDNITIVANAVMKALHMMEGTHS